MDIKTRNKMKLAKAKLKAYQDKVEQLPKIGDQVEVGGARGVVNSIDDAGRTAVVKFDHRFTAPVNIDSIEVIPAIDSDEEWPQVGSDAITRDGSAVTVACISGDLAWCECPTSSMQMITININNLKKLKSPKQESGEWPQVGDEVIAVNDHNELKGKLLALTKKYAIIHQGNDEQHLHLSAWALEKPKTPEEELRDEMLSYIEGVYSVDSCAIHEIAKDLIKYKNITKKQ